MKYRYDEFVCGDFDRRPLYRIGAAAALIQLAAILAYTVALAILGPKPVSVQEFFALQQADRLASVLRGDFLFLLLIGGYLGTFPALYIALRPVAPTRVIQAPQPSIARIHGLHR